jgi:NADPH2:quinone reductase
MRAIVIEEYGPPSVLALRELPDPVLGDGQVVVQVEAVSVTFIDTSMRRGAMPGRAPVPPYVPGNGVGGIVSACAPDVEASWLGRRVVTQTGGTGGYASVAAVPASGLIAVPDTVAIPDATALLADGRTAMGLVEAARVTAGDRVLVLAAAGGVGGLLVQLCATAGASVVAGVGDHRKADAAMSLGAADVVLYAQSTVDFPVVDIAFDGVGGEVGAAALAAVRPGGRFVQYGLSSGRPTVASRTDVTLIGFEALGAMAQRAASLTEQALAAAAAGQLRPIIGQTFPLAEAAAAHLAIESRATIGKTLLIP